MDTLNCGRLVIDAKEDVIVSNLTTNGQLPRGGKIWDNDGKETVITDGRTKLASDSQLVITTSNDVKIRDCEFNQTGYNGIDVCQSNTKHAKSVLIERVNFNAFLKHTAILIMSTQDNADVVIRDCEFNNFDLGNANPLRFSNTSKAKNVNVLVENCVFKSWQCVDEALKPGDAPYNGCLLLQNYKHGVEDVFTGNITFTFKNCTFPAQYFEMPASADGVEELVDVTAEVCGRNSDYKKQFCYMYADNKDFDGNKLGSPKLFKYGTDAYPTIYFENCKVA